MVLSALCLRIWSRLLDTGSTPVYSTLNWVRNIEQLYRLAILRTFFMRKTGIEPVSKSLLHILRQIADKNHYNRKYMIPLSKKCII